MCGGGGGGGGLNYFRSHIHRRFRHAHYETKDRQPCLGSRGRVSPVSIPILIEGARCSSVVRALAHGAMGRRIDPSCGEPIELFLVPVGAPRLV